MRIRPRHAARSPSSPGPTPPPRPPIKRRIEKQVEQTLGDRVRSVEVRVTGRTVVFRADASRFWYRRSVRRSLETMPLPSGYRARVEVGGLSRAESQDATHPTLLTRSGLGLS